MYNESVKSQAHTGHQVASAEEVTMLSRMVGGLQNHNAQIEALTNRLNGAIDRLIGANPPTPVNPESKGQRQIIGGLASELEDHLIRQERLIGDLESAIRRLSVL